MNDRYRLLTDADLDRLYDPPKDVIAKAMRKHLVDFHIDYLKVATFFILATGSDNGLDASPRGGAPGMIQILDSKTICFADWAGNNRIESLRNIVRRPEVGMVFIFPGLDIFMRINGHAGVTIDEAILSRLMEGGRPPKSAIVVSIDDVLFHCGKAVNRAALWKEASHIDRRAVPSPGVMMKALADIGDVPADVIDEAYSHNMVNDLYHEAEGGAKH